MKTHIDNLDERIEKTIERMTKQAIGENGLVVCDMAELRDAICVESKGYADERVRAFIFFVYESGEVRTGVYPMDGLSRLGEEFINQDTESFNENKERKQ